MDIVRYGGGPTEQECRVQVLCSVDVVRLERVQSKVREQASERANCRTMNGNLIDRCVCVCVCERSIIGTSSIDTTCTIWDVETQQVKTQVIAHDAEVYDIGFQTSELLVSAASSS